LLAHHLIEKLIENFY
jgi:hypothetical protein